MRKVIYRLRQTTLFMIITILLIMTVSMITFPESIGYSLVPVLIFLLLGFYLYNKATHFIDALDTLKENTALKTFGKYEIVFMAIFLLLCIAIISGMYSRLFLEGYPLFG